MTWSKWAAGCAFLAVAAGAFGAHGLRDNLDARGLEVWETAVQYHLVHALALLAVAALPLPARRRGIAGASFLVGIVVFSGSLYILALTGLGWLGAVTPAGGTAFLVGWAVLLASARDAAAPA